MGDSASLLHVHLLILNAGQLMCLQSHPLLYYKLVEENVNIPCVLDANFNAMKYPVIA